MNESFDSNIHVVGLSEYKGTHGIATTMPFIDSRGDHPTAAHVSQFMAARGFEQTGYNEVFYNPRTRVLASDARPDNFIWHSSGSVVPIDLGMQRVRPGGKIEAWLKDGGGFE